MTVGSGFELVNASTVTSQQSPVSGQEKVKSLRSKDTRQFNDSTIQQFVSSTFQRLTVDSRHFNNSTIQQQAREPATLKTKLSILFKYS